MSEYKNQVGRAEIAYTIDPMSDYPGEWAWNTADELLKKFNVTYK